MARSRSRTRAGSEAFCGRGGVSGVGADGRLPEQVESEVTQMFVNLKAVLHAGGATFADVIRMSVFAADRVQCREPLNRCWLESFPEAHSRPARHLMEQVLPGGMRVQCEVVAVIGEPR